MNIYSDNNTTPYFYIIRSKITNRMYAGARWAKGCHPDEFMKIGGYQTSSKTIKEHIEQHGLDSFDILRIDTNLDGMKAVDYETLFLQTIDCAKSDQWYNLYNSNNKFDATNPEIKRKIQQTFQEKYDCDSISGLQLDTEIKQKKINTCNNNHGCDYPMQSVEIKQKSIETCQIKYGCDNPMQSIEVRKKQTKSIQISLGVNHPSQSEIVKEKKKETCLENYGVDNPSKSEIVKEKKRQAMLTQPLFTCELCGKIIRNKGSFTVHMKSCIKSIKS